MLCVVRSVDLALQITPHDWCLPVVVILLVFPSCLLFPVPPIVVVQWYSGSGRSGGNRLRVLAHTPCRKPFPLHAAYLPLPTPPHTPLHYLPHTHRNPPLPFSPCPCLASPPHPTPYPLPLPHYYTPCISSTTTLPPFPHTLHAPDHWFKHLEKGLEKKKERNFATCHMPLLSWAGLYGDCLPLPLFGSLRFALHMTCSAHWMFHSPTRFFPTTWLPFYTFPLHTSYHTLDG